MQIPYGKNKSVFRAESVRYRISTQSAFAFALVLALMLSNNCYEKPDD